jgi:hypothetical protein
MEASLRGYTVRLIEEDTYPLPHGFRWRVANDSAHAALAKSICVPTKRYLWTPHDTIEFVPALSPRIYGDGRALLGLTTIHSRPAFYVIRIDSRWRLHDDRRAPDEPDFVEFLDEISQHLEEDFDCGRPDPDDEDEAIRIEGRPWPAFNDMDGSAWCRMDWPALDGFEFEPHPNTWRANLLRSPCARS